MNSEQKLYPHKIYQINQRLEELKEMWGIEERLVLFSILNYYKREFNWLVVNDERWTFDENIIDNINRCFELLKKERESLLRELARLNIEALVNSIEYFESDKKSNEWSEEERKEFHYHFLNLYQYYPHDAYAGIDGVIYRNFIRKRKRLLYAKGELLTDINNFNIYPWIDMTFVYESDVKIRSLSAQERQNDVIKDIEYTEVTFKNEIESIKGLKHNDSFKNEIYFRFMVPLVAGYPHPNKSGELFDGKNGENEFLIEVKIIKKLVNKYKYILCFPVYDTYIDKRLYGNFYGNVAIPFAFKEDRDEFLKENQKKIEENLFLLIR